MVHPICHRAWMVLTYRRHHNEPIILVLFMDILLFLLKFVFVWAYWFCFALFVFVLCLMYPMLSVSPDCPFVISPSVFSYVYSLMTFRCYFVLLMRVARLCSVLCLRCVLCFSVWIVAHSWLLFDILCSKFYCINYNIA